MVKDSNMREEKEVQMDKLLILELWIRSLQRGTHLHILMVM